MRAIIIEEARFAEVCDLMKLEAMLIAERDYMIETTGLTRAQLKAVVDEVHRSMHFHFVRWAQSQGASCVK